MDEMGLLLWAIAAIGSGWDADAVSRDRTAAGILQISPAMVEDCNRIIGDPRWELDDRFDIIESYEMAGVYFEHYCDGMTPEEMARCWVGGPNGYAKMSTAEYGRRVANIMERESKGVK